MRLAAFAVAVCVCLTPLTARTQEEAKANFAYVGPLRALLAEGKTPAVVTIGLPFHITLTETGKTISAGSFDLSVPGAEKPLHLDLDGLKFEGGHLTAKAKVVNGTGAAVEGVRLDVIGATETYKAKDDQGKEILKTRSQSAHLDSPLHFGDIKAGEDNGELDFDASGLAFTPETTQIVVEGVVSGLRFEAVRAFPGASGSGEVAVDAQSRIYISSTGNSVQRMDNDGSNVQVIAKPPDQCKGFALNPKTGEIAATCGNNTKIYLFTPSGDDKGSIGEDKGLDNFPSFLRYDASGALWGTVTSGPWKFGGDGKPVRKVTKAGDFDVDPDSAFDVLSDGTVYVISGKTLFQVAPDDKTAKRLATGPGRKPGQLINPASVRVDAAGNLYVAEQEGDNGSDAARISEFDRNGNLIRIFGRGGKTPDPNYPDTMLTGQLSAPIDIAFGPDGRVYISFTSRTEGTAVMIFRPF